MDHGPPVLLLLNLNRKLYLSGAGELCGVSHQVDQYLLDAVGVPQYPGGQAVTDSAQQLNALIFSGLYKFAHIIDQHFQIKIDFLEIYLPGLYFGIIKDVVYQGQEVKLCCDGCKPDFEKEPAKFIAKLAAKK